MKVNKFSEMEEFQEIDTEIQEEKTSEETDVEELLIITYSDKTGKELKRSVNIDKVAELIENKFTIRTIYGIKEETIEVYNEGIWSIKGKGIIKAEIEKLLGIYSKNNSVNEILEKIKRRTECSREEVDIVPEFKRCVSNGVLDLEDINDIKFIEHNKDYNFRSKFDIEYNPKIKIGKALEFFKETFYEDDLDKFQEWLGFHLVRKYSYKKFAIFHGPRDTGKSVLLNLMQKFVNGNVSGLSLQKISNGKSFDLLSLKDKDANICDDLSSSDMQSVGGIKMSVGHGSIEGEEKFGDRRKFWNTAKQSFACNRIPNPGKDLDDNAYYGRILLFPIENSVAAEKQDERLIDKITSSEEFSGILNWAIEGYIRLKKNNSFSEPKTAEEIKFMMVQGGNSIAEFSADNLTEEASFKVNKEVMYNVYCKWCLEHNPKLSPDSKDKLGKNLIKFSPFIQSAKSGSERYWLNVKLRDRWDTLKNNIVDLKRNDKCNKNNIYKSQKDVPVVPFNNLLELFTKEPNRIFTLRDFEQFNINNEELEDILNKLISGGVICEPRSKNYQYIL